MEQVKIAPDLTSFDIEIEVLPEDTSFDERQKRLRLALAGKFDEEPAEALPAPETKTSGEV